MQITDDNRLLQSFTELPSRLRGKDSSVSCVCVGDLGSTFQKHVNVLKKKKLKKNPSAVSRTCLARIHQTQLQILFLRFCSVTI